jgi:hypothetical protein
MYIYICRITVEYSVMSEEWASKVYEQRLEVLQEF